MQVSVAPIQQRTDVRVGADQVAGLIARKNSDLVRKIHRFEPSMIVLDIAQVAFLDCDVKVSPLKVALDVVLLVLVPE